jgi:hypothetical protein
VSLDEARIKQTHIRSIQRYEQSRNCVITTWFKCYKIRKWKMLQRIVHLRKRNISSEAILDDVRAFTVL